MTDNVDILKPRGWRVAKTPARNAEIAHDRLMAGVHPEPYLSAATAEALLEVARRHRTERTEQVRAALERVRRT